ncbi:hypothetical protein Cni_G12985 [Canna indica]|uniref:LRAT domain-containing protein n=1 Tax=Canna indica TaxID=4628 RepID=A0AAQ3KAI1_9LILI|nr:hypothetical protein Cni_G12985 [Canna indica]
MLEAGDHIYAWRKGYVYAHHGIYVGSNQVIHFAAANDKVISIGTIMNRFSSCSSGSSSVCQKCVPTNPNQQVKSSCLDCFLRGCKLRRFEYGVGHDLQVLIQRGGTCSKLPSSPSELVVHRATYLLREGFMPYNLFTNNCEGFARYCKTGYLPKDIPTASGQVNAKLAILKLAEGIGQGAVHHDAALAVEGAQKFVCTKLQIEDPENLMRVEVEELNK